MLTKMLRHACNIRIYVQVCLCFCRMWWQPAGQQWQLFLSWLPQRVFSLHALHLENICHTRWKGENMWGVAALIQIAFICPTQGNLQCSSSSNKIWANRKYTKKKGCIFTIIQDKWIISPCMPVHACICASYPSSRLAPCVDSSSSDSPVFCL